MDWSKVKGLTLSNNLAVKKIKRNGITLWEKASSILYRYIDPVDPTAFPQHTGLKIITIDGSENWKSSGGRMYSEYFRSKLNGQARAELSAYCAEFVFYPEYSISDLAVDGFCIWSNTDPLTNANLTFRKTGITTATAWAEYLEDNPITVLISTNDPDESVWKPAVRDADGVTGYWDGGDNFVPVKGGILYYGDNLITQDVIDGAYDNAWISSQFAWTTATDSASFPVPVTVGKRYRIAWDATDSDTVGTIFRYGFTDKNTPSSSNTLATPRDRTTPQDATNVEVEASKDYLVIQVSSALFPSNVGHLTVREMVGYDPSAELLTLLTSDNGGASSAAMLNVLGGYK